MRRILCALLAFVCVSVAAGDASAETTSLPLEITAGDATWRYVQDDRWIPGYPLGDDVTWGLGIGDVGYAAETGDYLIGALLLQVKGALYTDRDDVVDVVADTDRTSVVSTGRLKGAKVNVRYDFFNFRPVVRALFTFKNPGSTTLRLPVQVGTALGAGDQTLVIGTEDGDEDVENEDGWFAGSDNGQRPVIGGMGDGPVDLIDAPDNDLEGTDNLWIQRFDLSIKPKRTKRVLLFIEVTDETDFGDILHRAGTYDDAESLEGDNLLIGLTDTERKQVVNWDLPPAPIV